MSAPPATPVTAEPKKRVNLRTPDVMAAVQAQVENHYRSELVEKIRARGGVISAGGLTVRLAKQFGFCYGVERAIDLAYAARRVFTDKRLFILGEIIHNPEVNEQIRSMGIKNLIGPRREAELDELQADDVVLVPAFGAEVSTIEHIKAKGCQIVDTTCGDVMSVWKRVRQYAAEDATSIIHGKAQHEETKATASRALGKNGPGHYLVVLTLDETDYVCDYIRQGGDRAAFLQKFAGAHSPGFDPDLHLKTVGVANQTTMLRGETEEVQRRIRQAILDRDGPEGVATNFRFFDTICGATQERQDALRDLLELPMDLMLVVGGYNSSNTSHLAEMGAAKLPTYFIRNASRLESAERITHFDLHAGQEITVENWFPTGDCVVGVTAGASCPNHLIEETIKRLFALRGIDCAELI
ncbi:MAG: 4-hydroxy-3-methylbut-2-enyl diphosphate reductase [Verrucomicrobia bacterium]|nr:4-hydroxy-3-methylbut-2-enyl diphosphate reductase [Verrucomicrobiota bacterium]MBV9657252.1 4-hydroxy-3-methylbut-2-enyl diphosphate reductase [Verrucomicrobiota bacterium]